MPAAVLAPAAPSPARTLFESTVGALQDRAAALGERGHQALELAAGQKVAAVATSAAIASGGGVAAERLATQAPADARPAEAGRQGPGARAAGAARAPAGPSVVPRPSPRPRPEPVAPGARPGHAGTGPPPRRRPCAEAVRVRAGGHRGRDAERPRETGRPGPVAGPGRRVRSLADARRRLAHVRHLPWADPLPSRACVDGMAHRDMDREPVRNLLLGTLGGTLMAAGTDLSQLAG